MPPARFLEFEIEVRPHLARNFLNCSSMHCMAFILGIESSCDETSAAVVRDGEQLLSNVVLSQIVTHRAYGGVVPELASREHLRAIVPVVREALQQAGMAIEQINALAVTKGPGLAGALLVGLSYGKAVAFALEKPLIAVNHLEGHIHAVLLEARQSENQQSHPDNRNGGRLLEFPVLALVVSGGHTHLYLAEGCGDGSTGWRYHNVGHTRDDAAGEAFDKVAKLLAFGYPGGPLIELLAKHGNSAAIKFPPAQIKHRDRNDRSSATKAGEATRGPQFDFSFSGIKTAVLRYVETEGMADSIDRRRAALSRIAKPQIEDYLANCDRQVLDLAASFQRAVVEDLVGKTLAAAREYQAATLLVSGGVAANGELRLGFERRASAEGLRVLFPSRPLSTDNAAMIAAAAYPKWLAHDFATPELSAEASLPLG
jgi:N6-L-threonylcarbamoyladenine synthase